MQKQLQVLCQLALNVPHWVAFDHGLILHGGQKIELTQKYMQVEVDVKCMHIYQVCSVVWEILLPSNLAKFPSSWESKN